MNNSNNTNGGSGHRVVRSIISLLIFLVVVIAIVMVVRRYSSTTTLSPNDSANVLTTPIRTDMTEADILSKYQKITNVDDPAYAQSFTLSMYQFKYPKLLTRETTADGAGVRLYRSIPYIHPDPCNFRGDAGAAGMLDTLTDADFTIKIRYKDMKTVMAEDNIPMAEAEVYNISSGNLKGYSIQRSVEGCGEISYYIELEAKSAVPPNTKLSLITSNQGMGKTLHVKRKSIAELSSVIDKSAVAETLRKSGAMPPAIEEALFNNIMQSITKVEVMK